MSLPSCATCVSAGRGSGLFVPTRRGQVECHEHAPAPGHDTHLLCGPLIQIPHPTLGAVVKLGKRRALGSSPLRSAR